MKEIDFYPEIARKFKQSITSKYPQFDVAYSCNKELPQMIEEVEKELNCDTVFSGSFIPKLKLDILFAIRNRQTGTSDLILFEVKYEKYLTLSNYSQLLGYLQIAKKIQKGVLLLVNKGGHSTNGFSNDFAEIVNANVLPMDWTVNEYNDTSERTFQTAICQYFTGGMFRWMNASQFNGLSSVDEIVSGIV